MRGDSSKIAGSAASTDNRSYVTTESVLYNERILR